MNKITYITNGHYRELFPMAQDENFELLELDNEAVTDDMDFIQCFKYKGDIYPLNEFPRCSEEEQEKGFHASLGFSCFNGLYITLSDDCEGVKVTYFYQ